MRASQGSRSRATESAHHAPAAAPRVAPRRAREKRALFALAAVAALAGCAAETTLEAHEAELRFAAAPPAIPPDPGAETQYACVSSRIYGWSDPTYGATWARVTYAGQLVGGTCSSNAIGGGPVVLFTPEAGFSASGYLHLTDHLARNGFVVVSVYDFGSFPPNHCDPSLPVQPCADDQADRAVRLLESWRASEPVAALFDFDHIVTAGHGRGGEAAAIAARRIAESPSFSGPVDAVIALAPTDVSAVELRDDAARSLLVLYGSRDADVRTARLDATQPAPTGFTAYDRSGTDYGTESAWRLPAEAGVEKAFAFLREADHRQFSDGCTTSTSWPGGVLACDAQQAATRSFVTAWARLQARGEDAYRVFFDDTLDHPFLHPPVPSGEPVLSFGQYDDGRPWTRRVIDNFQDGELLEGTDGSTFSAAGVHPEVVGPRETAPSTPHGPEDGRFLRVSRTGDRGDAIQWRLSDDPAQTGVDEFAYISLRAGREHERATAWVWAPPRLRIQLRLVDGTLSPELPLHYLPDPDGHSGYWSIEGGVYRYTPPHGVSPMRTLRVSLNDFGVDLRRVDAVILHLDSPELSGEAVLLDDLQLGGGRRTLTALPTSCAAAGVAPPAAPDPAPVVPPTDPECVATTGCELRQLLTSTCERIELAPGTFDLAGCEADTPFPWVSVRRPVELVGHGAATVLEFGVELRPPSHPAVAGPSASGSRLSGVVFDIADPAYAVHYGSLTAAVLFWEQIDAVHGLRDITLEDLTVRGHGVIDEGILGTAPRGAAVRRVRVEDTRHYGVNVRNRRPVQLTTADGARLEDIDVVGVSEPECMGLPGGASWDPSCGGPGTRHVGIAVGASHLTLTRARVRDAYWTGVAVVHRLDDDAASYPAVGVRLEQIDVDRIGLGSDDGPSGEAAGRGAGAAIYIENVTHGLQLERFCTGPETERGVNIEWDKCNFGWSARDARVARGFIDSTYAGVLADWGTTDLRVEDVFVSRAREVAFVFRENCDHDPLLDCERAFWEPAYPGEPPPPCACTSDATNRCNGDGPQDGTGSTTTWQGLYVGTPDICPPGLSTEGSPCLCPISYRGYNEDRWCADP